MQTKFVVDHRLFHRTGDVGYFDQSGNLWYCGRKRDCLRISWELNGLVQTLLPPVCVEGIIDAKLGRDVRSAMIPFQDKPVILLERFPVVQTTTKKELISVIFEGSAFEGFQFADLQTYPHRFPTDATHNSKIRRDLLATWYTQNYATSK